MTLANLGWFHTAHTYVRIHSFLPYGWSLSYRTCQAYPVGPSIDHPFLYPGRAGGGNAGVLERVHFATMVHVQVRASFNSARRLLWYTRRKGAVFEGCICRTLAGLGGVTVCKGDKDVPQTVIVRLRGCFACCPVFCPRTGAVGEVEADGADGGFRHGEG